MSNIENNRKIAEWLEPFETLPPNSLTGAHSPKNAWIDNWYDNVTREWQPVDFYIDEEANAMLLDAMPLGTNVWHLPNMWSVESFTREVLADSPDRKTAICEAFIKKIIISGFASTSTEERNES